MGCGIDIIETGRIEKALLRHKRFKNKVFTENEIRYFEESGRRVETLAGMFAAKEAFAKYLGTGIGRISFRDIEVCRLKSGKPYVKLCGIKQGAALSISHCREYAAAVVTDGAETAECKEPPRFTLGGDGDLAAKENECRAYASKMRGLIPSRADDANKGNCGRVVIVAGSKGMTGAAVLSALGALRGGAGLVTVMTPSSEQPIVAAKLTEAMTVPLAHENGIIAETAAEDVIKHIQNADVAVFGPGLGRGTGVLKVLERLVSEFEKTLIIDADGINALSTNIDILYKRRCEIILTPHPGEMSRLNGMSVSDIQAAREKTAADFAEKFGVTLALKGKGTVVADGKAFALNPSGNCGMATGGTGDVLSGIVAAFAAQGCKAFEAALLGVYLHGRAGDLAALKKGVYGLIASDLCDELPAAILETLNTL